MKKAQCWSAFWNILRYGILVVILVNTVVLLCEGNTIFGALVDQPLLWLIYFISKFVLLVTKEYLKQSKSEREKPSDTSEKQDNALRNTAEENSKQQKTE